MKIFNNKKIILAAIILLAAVLRFHNLGKVPPSLQWDEVAMGYDAYSILRTGKDQFGKTLPVFFRSLDDWKPAFYEYAAVVPIGLFGLNAFAVRFPAALFGVLSVYFTYDLVKMIAKDKQKSRQLSLLTAFLLAVSPWHLQISRAGFEVTISIFLFILAVWAFYKSLKNAKFLWLSSILFGLGFYTYHSARVVFPLMWVSLGLIFHNFFAGQRKRIFAYIAPFIVLLGLFVPHGTGMGTQMRFQATNILEMQEYADQSAEMILEDKQRGAYFVGKIFHNRRLSFINWENISQMLTNYFSHFRPDFLFIKGDAPLHHAPGMGLLYAVQLPFLGLGIILFLKNDLKRRNLVFLIWLLLGPFPASVTWGVPHAIRAALLLPTFSVFTAYGFWHVFKFICQERKFFAYLFSGTVAVLLIYNIGYYLHQYHVHLPYETSKDWVYGRKQAAAYTEKNKGDYQAVIVSTKLEYPWVFWLFHTKYSPKKYLQNGGTVSGGFAVQENSFDKYFFRRFDYQKEKKENKLFVGLPKEFPADAEVVKEIEYLNGEEAIIIAK
jgi:4-amino-4-deoxy-L-arabinose transferase-like glycosyltransferase